MFAALQKHFIETAAQYSGVNNAAIGVKRWFHGRFVIWRKKLRGSKIWKMDV